MRGRGVGGVWFVMGMWLVGDWLILGDVVMR